MNRVWTHAKVAELVDALALGASGATRESSSLSFRTSSRPCLQILAPVCRDALYSRIRPVFADWKSMQTVKARFRISMTRTGACRVVE